MKLKEIHRTSTFAWSPSASLPLLATGTVAGALDESFSNESQLEIWAPDFLDRDEFDLGREGGHGPKGRVTDTARFNRLAWGHVDAARPQGVIAAGLENGELALWDPAKILSGASASESLILRNTTHTGPVRGLDFNPLQTSLLASGGVSGEVYIWDLKDPSKPYSPTPGQRSTKLDEITSVAWNQQVQYVLAGASSTGFTVVWDLRGKREVVALTYGGGAGTLAGQSGTGMGMAVGGRRGMSDIAWHPDNATRLVTASEDDSSPILMVWDLRNARAPEKILTGHEKGVLSLSWCKQDADLLLSCGKDNRALCWNPQTYEVIGELPSADNWAFQVDWCPRNPDMLATAFFDGTIGIHSIQSTNEPLTDAQKPTPRADGADIFDAPGFSRSGQQATLSLKQPPKWLRRPVSASFGFGGNLVTVSNLSSAQGKTQSSVVHIRKVVTESDLVERATKLQAAIEGDSLQTFAEEKTTATEETTTVGSEGWKALLSLFKANSRNELVTLLGFSKAEIAARVAEAVENLKAAAEADAAKSPYDGDATSTLADKPHESVVSFAEPESEEVPSDRSEVGDDSEAATPFGADEQTLSEAKDEEESATTAPSLFGDDIPGTPQHDFFNTVGVAQDNGESHPVLVPHTNYGIDSSVAATTGSGPSSVTSEVLTKASGASGFRIYPSEESDNDRLVTKALVLGDFESAVSLCLSSDRYADAILLAVRGGPELLQRTQKAYFERRTTQQPYLRLLQSIVSNDLSDIVQNADLQEWREIFVVICTFAGQEEFPTLAEQLGSRLEYQFTVSQGSDDPEVVEEAYAFRKNATLTYLASARLERLINIWADELLQEEKALVADESNDTGSYYSAHAHALQTFIEKVTVFRAATNYKDEALTSSSAEPAQAYKLASLYDRYFEYAELLSTQGLLKEAVSFLKLTPAGYKGATPGADLESERKRLVAATTAGPVASTSTAVPAPVTSTAAPTRGPYAPSVAQTQAPSQPYATRYGPTGGEPKPPVPQQQSAYAPPTQSAYAPPAAQQSAYAPPATQTGYAPPANNYQNPYNRSTSLTQPPHLRQPPPQPDSFGPPPPRAQNGTPSNSNIPPAPPPKRDTSIGWNDPVNVPSSRPPAALNLNKPAAITSPFPNAPATPGYSPQGSPYIGHGQASATLPPPPRPGSVGLNRGGSVPPPAGGPPPPGGPGIRGPPSAGVYPGPPGPGVRPPSRLMSPSQGQNLPPPPQRQPTPSQYAPPPSRGPAPGHTPPPPGQYGRPPAPGQGLQQQQHQQAPPPPGPYGPGPGHVAQPPPPGPYGPPPQQHPGPSQQQQPSPPQQAGGPPPPPGGPGAPPRTVSRSAAPARAAPAAPKYPVGDRSHIPEYAQPAFVSISNHLTRMKQTVPANQKRLIDDLERRINPLFDALNCETISRPVVDQLIVLTRAMDARDRAAALSIHVELLTRGSQTDDIGLWMSGIKQLIMSL
uniref:Protein transport protein SEC31 n=1 Tax=Psilocybe cubensis TaxID=181762 RepID=A0A8H7XM78_PSICU